jgi:hypothetical protein
MNRKSIVIGVTLGLIIMGTVGSAAARQQKGQFEFSGTFINTAFDVNADGLKAGLSTTGTKGSLGPMQGKGVVEFVFNPVANCPAGQFGLTLVTQDAGGNPVVWRFVQRFNSTGDLLISQYTAATLCIDPTTGIQAGTAEVAFIGGTGKYEGATGTASCVGTAMTLVADANGNFFGEQSGTCEFTINLD